MVTTFTIPATFYDSFTQSFSPLGAVVLWNHQVLL
jgi:hypothetical protein